MTGTPAREGDLEFDPLFPLRDAPQEAVSDRVALARPDLRSGAVYDMTAGLHLAVEVALTTGRPLLLRGDPGTGKSSLAPFVARVLGWRFHEHVVTSTSTSDDLIWRFDAVKRLSDAQGEGAKSEEHYLRPGVLWWAFDPVSASEANQRSTGTAPDDGADRSRAPRRTVVLVDEIDKAHPDLPNGLLVALGNNRLDVPHRPVPVTLDEDIPPPDGLPQGVEVAPVLVVVTTNEERELPPAFVRRCITYRLEHPSPARLETIAQRHFGVPGRELGEPDRTLAREIAERVGQLRDEAAPGMRKPSTAEFLDAFRACRHRGIRPDVNDPRWRLVEEVVLVKPGVDPVR